MSKLDFITILIVVICIGALGFLVYKTVGVMESDGTTPTEQVVDNTTDDTTTDEYDFDDEGNIRNDTSDASTSTTNADEEYPIDEETGDSEQDTETIDLDDDEPAIDDDDDEDIGDSQGKYLVLAGSYKEKVNAEIQVSKLRKMGYNNAAVKSFNRGAYAVALVERFDNFSDAAALKRKLMDKGIDVFVKKKK